MRASDGKYHVNGLVCDQLVGSRAQVWHGTAYKTKGDLTKKDLFMNKRGHIVSKKKHNTAKKEKRLEKHGYFAQKGKFGAIRKDGTKVHSKRKRKTHKRKTHRRRR